MNLSSLHPLSSAKLPQHVSRNSLSENEPLLAKTMEEFNLSLKLAGKWPEHQGLIVLFKAIVTKVNPKVARKLEQEDLEDDFKNLKVGMEAELISYLEQAHSSLLITSDQQSENSELSQLLTKVIEIHISLGDYWEANKYIKLLSCFSKLFSQHDNLRLLVQRGSLEFLAGNYLGSQKYYSQFSAELKNSEVNLSSSELADYSLKSAQLMLKLNKLKDTRSYLSSAHAYGLEGLPQLNANYHFVQGEFFLKVCNYEAALRYFSLAYSIFNGELGGRYKELAACNNGMAEAFLNLGQLLAANEQLGKGQQLLKNKYGEDFFGLIPVIQNITYIYVWKAETENVKANCQLLINIYTQKFQDDKSKSIKSLPVAKGALRQEKTVLLRDLLEAENFDLSNHPGMIFYHYLFAEAYYQEKAVDQQQAIVNSLDKLCSAVRILLVNCELFGSSLEESHKLISYFSKNYETEMLSFLDKSLAELKKSAKVNRAELIPLYVSLGNNYYDLCKLQANKVSKADFNIAYAYLDTALRLSLASNGSAFNLSSAYDNLILLSALHGNRNLAVGLQSEAISQLKSMGKKTAPDLLAGCYYSLADLYYSKDFRNFKQALSSYQTALGLYKLAKFDGMVEELSARIKIISVNEARFDRNINI